ncbi:hypothetical protein L914_12374 [Phytophthora nicotianae]|uniref:Uncharacterized protein n=2 Tax=Phytophthora nicotianae TaxID=4792 RepID=W2N203_PHYNI|nr:hypothetical protein L914_12374 [Phytophthora nicotianae]ETO70597.1 hypothetical protein F444_12942 [Phytophthora nicotianae P1976]
MLGQSGAARAELLLAVRPDHRPSRGRPEVAAIRTEAYYGAVSAVATSASGSRNAVSGDGLTWAELNEYLAANIPVTD